MQLSGEVRRHEKFLRAVLPRWNRRAGKGMEWLAREDVIHQIRLMKSIVGLAMLRPDQKGLSLLLRCRESQPAFQLKPRNPLRLTPRYPLEREPRLRDHYRSRTWRGLEYELGRHQGYPIRMEKPNRFAIFVSRQRSLTSLSGAHFAEDALEHMPIFRSRSDSSLKILSNLLSDSLYLILNTFTSW